MRHSRSTTVVIAALFMVFWGPNGQSVIAGEQLDQTAYCEKYAGGVAARNARETETGIDLHSALQGAAEGVILGEIAGGRRHRRMAAREGGAIGAAAAGIDFRPRFDRLYRRAFAACMAQ